MIDRDAVVAAQGGYCWWCGVVLGGRFAVHHRRLRKHGGGDHWSNLIALHDGCHNVAKGSVHQEPAEAYRRGFLVHSWDDQREVPVILSDGSRVRVTEDGWTVPAHDEDGEDDGWRSKDPVHGASWG